MRTAVIFATKTGHSRKLAVAIGKELTIEPQEFRQLAKFQPVDLLFLVGGIYAGKSLPEFLGFIQSLQPEMVRKVVLVTSSMGKRTRQDAIRRLLLEKGIEVSKDEFTCQGSFLFFGMGHPDASEIEAAAAFAREQSAQS